MKKIMFNDKYGLTKAVLEGRKTQTRRVATKEQLRRVLYFPKYANRNMDELAEACVGNYATQKFAPYVVGEEVAVAMCYGNCGTWFFPVAEYGHMAGYTNKMFVRAEDMPYRIKITNVRVERLQDISDEDCLKEGVVVLRNNQTIYGVTGIWDGSYKDGHAYKLFSTPREAYAALINKTCGKGTWESNPWVFVYDFGLIK